VFTELWVRKVKADLNMANMFIVIKMTLNGCTWFNIPWTSTVVTNIENCLPSALNDKVPELPLSWSAELTSVINGLHSL
jgi:hypothetical protein